MKHKSKQTGNWIEVAGPDPTLRYFTQRGNSNVHMVVPRLDDEPMYVNPLSGRVPQQEHYVASTTANPQACPGDDKHRFELKP